MRQKAFHVSINLPGSKSYSTLYSLSFSLCLLMSLIHPVLSCTFSLRNSSIYISQKPGGVISGPIHSGRLKHVSWVFHLHKVKAFKSLQSVFVSWTQTFQHIEQFFFFFFQYYGLSCVVLCFERDRGKE